MSLADLNLRVNENSVHFSLLVWREWNSDGQEKADDWELCSKSEAIRLALLRLSRTSDFSDPVRE